MTNNNILLVSPGPVDGYPPVQYQAKLLADAGHAVTLVTTTLVPDYTRPLFDHPGVKVLGVSSQGHRAARILRFANALLRVRIASPADTIEIAYDPIGLFYSDFVPFHPNRRIAHLHELLQHTDLFIERRMKRAIQKYCAVVVPDEDRADHTVQQLAMSTACLVVENYPLRADKPVLSAKHTKQRFEVVYCGSLGLNQKLDAVIHSIPDWPESADLILIGNDTTPIARSLRALTQKLGVKERVQFLGWMDTASAERRMAMSDLGVGLLDTSSMQLQTALGASNKRYQYMKAGLPQIGDQNPGVPELLKGIGACVQNHHPAEIATLVSAYVEDPVRCAEEGARAFARHQETYNYERVFKRVQDLIDSW